MEVRFSPVQQEILRMLNRTSRSVQPILNAEPDVVERVHDVQFASGSAFERRTPCKFIPHNHKLDYTHLLYFDCTKSSCASISIDYSQKQETRNAYRKQNIRVVHPRPRVRKELGRHSRKQLDQILRRRSGRHICETTQDGS